LPEKKPRGVAYKKREIMRHKPNLRLDWSMLRLKQTVRVVRRFEEKTSLF
jgi:hypothetical protein